MVVRQSSGMLYNTIWRWHFYAGLFVAPFALILALTGGIYLFQPQIEKLLYADLYEVIPASYPVPADAQLASALAQLPGSKGLAYLPPETTAHSALVRVRTQQSGQGLRVYTVAVNPYTSKVIGIIDDQKRLMQIVRNIHGKLLSGKIGQAVVELAASWAMVLLISGMYLWWPRNKASLRGVFFPRLRVKGRSFWRDLHSVTGFWTSFLLIFLILTGLPWSLVAGKVINIVETQVEKGALQTGIGWDGGGSQNIKSNQKQQGWATEHAEHLAGNAHSHSQVNVVPLTLESILHITSSMQGISLPYEIRLPVDEHGVFSVVNVHESTPETTAYIHLDQYTGHVVSEAGWQDFGLIAKSISLGVSLHEGRYFGLANQLLCLAACVGLILMVAAGLVMWWWRKPEGALGAPVKVNAGSIGIPICLIVIALSMIMPLMGASLLLIFTGEWLVRYLKRSA